MWSFKNSSALRACGCNYCLYGQVYSFSFLPSLCIRKRASFQAFCFITIGRKFPKFRVCLTQVPDFILRVTLKSWAGTDLHGLKFLKVLGSSLLHFPSLSISITKMGCMFSFPFSFFWFYLCKIQCPFTFSHYIFFCPQLSCQTSCCLHCWSAPQLPLSPRTIPFLSQHPFWVFEIILSISPLLLSFPWFPMSPSFPLPIPFLSSSLLCPPDLHPSAQLPSSIPFYALSSSWGLSLWRSPSHSPLPPPTTFSPLVCLLWLLPELGSPSSSAPSLSPCLSSCFDGAGINVAQDVRSECLPGGLLLCWSVGTHFPPRHRE